MTGQCAQWFGVLSLHQKVAGLILGQGTYPGCRFNLLFHIDMCVCMCVPPPNHTLASLSKINKSIPLGEDLKIKISKKYYNSFPMRPLILVCKTVLMYQNSVNKRLSIKQLYWTHRVRKILEQYIELCSTFHFYPQRT